MRAIDSLNQCTSSEQLRILLEGRSISMHLICNVGSMPCWLNQGQLSIDNETYGVSNHVQEVRMYEILYEEFQKPKNRGPMPDATHTGYAHLPRCNDIITLRMLVEGGMIRDAKWEGQGCVICLASASVMSQWLIGKKQYEAVRQYLHFEKLMLGNGDIAPIEEELLIFEPIRANHLKAQCVLIPWLAFANCKEEKA